MMTGASFLGLSREIRDQIYHEVLYSPRGIRLHDAKDDKWAEDGMEDERSLRGSHVNPGVSFDRVHHNCFRAEYDRGFNDSENDDNPNDSARLLDEITIDHRISTSLLYVNRQIYLEASQVLYTINRITFDIDAKFVLGFLKSLTSTTRSHIRHLGFARQSSGFDDEDCTRYWKALYAYIRSHLQISSVTIQIPNYADCSLFRAKRYKKARMGYYWWPAVFALTDMLLEGKLQELCLVHSHTYLHPGTQEEAEEVNDINFAVISLLQYPCLKEELCVECQEGRHENWQAKCEGRPAAVSSLDAWKGNQSDRRGYLDFFERRKDDQFGDLGIIVILTLRR